MPSQDQKIKTLTSNFCGVVLHLRCSSPPR